MPTTSKTPVRLALDRVAEGKPCVGQWMEYPGYTLARTIASLGPDWVLIDCEHGNIDDKDMYYAVGAIAAAGSSPIVRVPGSEPWMIKRALDCGAHGIMIPQCETKEQAESIVRSVKYPSKAWPTGARGVGGLFAPVAFNQTPKEYLLNANTDVLTIVQIESRKALENCEEIAGVEGIDMLFIGPNDLASSMGYFAFDHAKIPEVQEATRRILKAARDAGKYAGHFALSGEIAAQKFKEGFEFVNCGADIVAIQSWMGAELEKVRACQETLANGKA